MKSDRLRFAPLGLAFFIPLLLYVRWPSYEWNVDGVACAAALELGNPVYFFHADHLIYGGVGYAFWHFLLQPFGLHRALPALQILTFLLTVVGLIGLYLFMAAQGSRDRWRALLLTLLIAVSAIVWVWSIEAQVYSVGFAALAWATYLLLEGKSKAALRWAGVLEGIAILGHLMHGLWLIPAAYWIFQKKSNSHRERLREFAKLVLFAGVTSLVAYGLVYQTVLVPAHLSHIGLMNWFKGSVGLTPDRHWSWHTQGWLAPLRWMRSSLSFFWGTFWPYGQQPMARWIWPLTAVSMAAIIYLLVRSVGSPEKAKRNFALIWIGVYALLLWTWEPSTLCYRMTEGIPLALLLSLGLTRLAATRSQIILASVVALSLFIINTSTRIVPMNNPQNNTLYMYSIALANETPQNSLYLTDAGVTWIYLLYFTGREARNVATLPSADIETFLTATPKRMVLLGMDIYNRRLQEPFVAGHHWLWVKNLPWMELQ